VRSAVSLCGSLFANVFRFDGELLHFVAGHNVGLSYVELLRAKYPMRPDFSQVSGRVLRTKSVVRLEDVLADPEYDQRFSQAMGWRKILGMPLLREGAFRALSSLGVPPALQVQQPQIVSDHPHNPLTRVANTKEIQHIPDLTEDHAYIERNPRIVALVESGGARNLLVVPMLKEDELIGAIAIYRQEMCPFTDKQIDLVQNFTAQAVAVLRLITNSNLIGCTTGRSAGFSPLRMRSM
jgi:GAF domain-containing protein